MPLYRVAAPVTILLEIPAEDEAAARHQYELFRKRQAVCRRLEELPVHIVLEDVETVLAGDPQTIAGEGGSAAEIDTITNLFANASVIPATSPA
jgi:hypothetical protein